MKNYCNTFAKNFCHIDEYKKIILKELILPYCKGNVCDIWSSYMWIYWSLWYIDKTQEIAFLDRDISQLTMAESIIQNCTSDYFKQSFWETIDWLNKHDIKTNYDQTLQQRNEKIETFEYSYFDKVPEEHIQLYDTALCIETLECCNTEEQLYTATQNCLSFLKPGWKILISVIRYNENRSFAIDHLRTRWHEWLSNPKKELIESILKDKNCNILKSLDFDTSALYWKYWYTDSYIIAAEKK